ncbi:hypothetical protein ACIQOW_14010 [Kitasatospora sp. NPDC091335]|uniref:hypothetical protein n=1 Tax=Kitasatospora sp. NPDC091335 TaxID=3364085 RepID=UPI00381E320B
MAVPDLSPTSLVADPYGGCTRLRAGTPVPRVVGPDGLPFRLVTRCQDVRQALADPRLGP